MAERRQSHRIPVNLSAKFFSGGNIFEGYIENISEDGLEYYMTSFVSAPKEFFSKRSVDLQFQSPDGNAMDLKCELIWFLETTPNKKDLLLGMKIKDPPPTFKEFVEHLN